MPYTAAKQRKPDERAARMGTGMDRLLVAIMIALAALVMVGGFAGKTLAEETVRPPRIVAETATRSPTPVTIGQRSERVLSLILALEALRAAPALISPKV